MNCDLKKYNNCNGKNLKKISSLNWACPIVKRICKENVKHNHTVCNECYKYVNLQLENLKKR